MYQLSVSCLLLAIAATSKSVQAHTTFTNFFVNGVPQGDGTCVRMSSNIPQATFPISSVDSNDMACGVNGQTAVARVCPASAGNTITFEFRDWPNGERPGSIDASHKGPCAIYMKQVESALANDTAVGDGWFKIFSEDYNSDTGKWCTENLIPNDGHLTVNIPSDLKAGYYLVRPELLALQQADKTPADPQFYVGCAQIFLSSTGSSVPSSSDTVSIPGYISMENNAAALTYSIYEQPLKLPYPMFGPPVYVSNPSGSVHVNSKIAAMAQTEGLEPLNCILVNDNWCGIELESYSNEAGCWSASRNCWSQATACYTVAGPTGSKNCPLWETKCTGIQQACNAGNFNGPPNAGMILTPSLSIPASLPPVATRTSDPINSPTESSPASTQMSLPEPNPSAMSPQVIDGLPNNISIDECGSRNATATCATGMCCSQHGFCGTSVNYCGAGCQSGACVSNSSKIKRRHIHEMKHVHGHVH